MTAPALPVMLPQAFPRDPEHWLRAPERQWFRDGWGYAQTQTRAIPALSKCSAEELYFAVWSILRGAKLPDPEQTREPLTKRQREMVDYLRSFRDNNGYMPSFEEIADFFGFRSLATVAEHLGNLQRKGWIHRAYNEARSITLVEAPC